jgi:hypothetical protein
MFNDSDLLICQTQDLFNPSIGFPKTDAQKLAASDRLSWRKQNSNLSATLETKNKP